MEHRVPLEDLSNSILLNSQQVSVVLKTTIRQGFQMASSIQSVQPQSSFKVQVVLTSHQDLNNIKHIGLQVLKIAPINRQSLNLPSSKPLVQIAIPN